MKIVELIQGTQEWNEHRVKYFNASEASIMLGRSANKRRTDLLDEKVTGVVAEISDFTQGIMNKGHEFEAKARALAEEIVGEDLFPCVGVEGPYSASFDGLTLLEDIAWEHKSMNEDLRAAFVDIDTINPDHRERSAAKCLPEMYRIQMEQQCLVSGAGKVLFTASKWNDKGELIEARHCWYFPDAELRATIVTGWEQFRADMATHKPGQLPVKHVGKAPSQVPALRVEASGVVIASNLAEFKAQALTVLSGINRDLKTDEDFADAEQTVKWASGVEEKLQATKDNVIAQMTSVEEVLRTLDDVGAEVRRIRLDLEKQIKADKEKKRQSIVDDARASVVSHYAQINASMGEYAIAVPASLAGEIGNAIKGKRTFASITEAANVAATAVKIKASKQAEVIRENMAIIADHAEHKHLLADRVALCHSKAPEDLRNAIKMRIDAYETSKAEERAREERIAQQQRDAQQRQEQAQPAKNDAPLTASAKATSITSRGAVSFGATAGVFTAEVTDFDTFIAFLIDEHTIHGENTLVELLQVNMEALNKRAAVLGGKLNYPGVTVRKLAA